MLDNDQIAKNVNYIVDKYLEGVKVRPEDKETILAGKELFINVLQNLSSIAWSLQQIEENQRSQR